MMLHKMGWIFHKVLYPSLTWQRYGNQKIIYLTFDDGPIPEMTPAILDLLIEFEAKATFFCVGDNIKKHPDIFRRLLQEGHSIGNHTYNHLNGWQNKNKTYFENIKLCNTTIVEKGGTSIQTKFFRPPYGRIKHSQIQHLLHDYEIVMWDVLSGDFSHVISKETCLQKSIKYTEPGSIIVFHDNLKAKKNLDFTLPRYLEHFTKYGYIFKGL
ncbi:MAG: polysaccharide deacetylase family protein [Bacteroidota bacterium]